jgi:hypothetical protein
VLVLGEMRVVVGLAQPVRVLAFGLELHQIDNIDHSDLQRGQRRSQNATTKRNCIVTISAIDNRKLSGNDLQARMAKQFSDNLGIFPIRVQDVLNELNR